MPDDVEPSQAELFRVEARYEGAEAIITLAGELEYSTAERFVACILEVLDTKPRSVTVDLRRVTFSDSSGLAALLRARDLAFVDQVVFRIKDPSLGLRRLLEVTGTKDLLLPDECPEGSRGHPPFPRYVPLPPAPRAGCTRPAFGLTRRSRVKPGNAGPFPGSSGQGWPVWRRPR